MALRFSSIVVKRIAALSKDQLSDDPEGSAEGVCAQRQSPEIMYERAAHESVRERPYAEREQRAKD
jgi:hypothetical protein